VEFTSKAKTNHGHSELDFGSSDSQNSVGVSDTTERAWLCEANPSPKLKELKDRLAFAVEPRPAGWVKSFNPLVQKVQCPEPYYELRVKRAV